MAFFDDLGKKISSAAQGAADKAKELADVARLNSEVSTQEKIIAQSYIEIGKHYFELERENSGSPVAAQCEKIAAAQAAIEDLKLKIAAIKAAADSEVSG